jgi:hypothetical protein
MGRPKKGVNKAPKKESHKVDMVTITMPLCLLGNALPHTNIRVGKHYYSLDLKKEKQGFILKPTVLY